MKLVTPINRHILDDNHICSCGRTRMQHFAIELENERIKEKRYLDDIELEKDFSSLGEVIKKTIEDEDYIATGFFILMLPIFLPLELFSKLVKLLVKIKK